MTGREFHVPPEEERTRDRDLIAALDEHEPIGERYARTGEIPISTARQPSMIPAPGDDDRDATPVLPLPTPPRFVGRTILRAVLALVLLGLLYLAVTMWQVWSTGRSDQARSVDAIVVMGAAQYDGRPSPQLAARLDHAVALWPEGLAPQIIVTGGKQPGDRFTEAEASAAYLVERGVPEEAIVLENAGRSTMESWNALAAQVGGSVESVLIVTDPYHALRSRMIAAEVGFEAYVSPAEGSVVTGGEALRREVEEGLGVAVGRIIGFDRLSGLTG